MERRSTYLFALCKLEGQAWTHHCTAYMPPCATPLGHAQRCDSCTTPASFVQWCFGNNPTTLCCSKDSRRCNSMHNLSTVAAVAMWHEHQKQGDCRQKAHGCSEQL